MLRRAKRSSSPILRGGGGATLLAHNFEFHEKNSTVIAGRLRRLLLVWRTRRPQTPHKERASISLAVVAYGEFFAVRKSSAKTVSWGRLGFVLFCVLRISRTNFDHSSNPQSRRVFRLRQAWRAVWRVPQAAVN